MAAVLDFSKFTFTAEQIRDVKELIYDDVIQSPEISMLHTIYEGIVFDKEIGFIGQGGLVGMAGQGCSPTPQAYNIGTRMVKWEPKSWGIYIQQCSSDLEAVAAVYSLKTGTSVDDFSASDYMAIIIEKLTQSIKEFIIRLFWFNDTAADNFADGGTITNGINPGYFTILNGFFKQFATQVTANAKQKTAISENAGVSYAAQALVTANVQGYLSGAVFGADLRLRQKANGFILCTQSVYDAYAKSLQGVSLETMYANLVNGQKTLTYNGIPLVPMPIWDMIINAYFNNGTKWVNPHRIVYTTKDILAIGVDSISSFGDMNVYYDQKTEFVETKVKGKADAKLLNPEMFQIAI